MKTYQQFVEDLQSKRMAAKQKSIETISRHKETVANDKQKRISRIEAMKQEYRRRNRDLYPDG